MKVVKCKSVINHEVKLESTLEFVRITPQLVAQLTLANEECKRQLKPFLCLKDGESIDDIPVDQINIPLANVSEYDVPTMEVFKLVIKLYRGIVEDRV